MFPIRDNMLLTDITGAAADANLQWRPHMELLWHLKRGYACEFEISIYLNRRNSKVKTEIWRTERKTVGPRVRRAHNLREVELRGERRGDELCLPDHYRVGSGC